MSDIVQECAPMIVKAKPFAMAQLKLAKHSPEIMVGVGIVSMVAGTVLACRATLKAPAALASAKEKFADIEDARVLGEEGKIDYSKKDRQQDLVAASFQTGVEFVKLYAVPTVLIGAGIFSITKGHSITVKRNAAISSALTTLSSAYKAYRDRVRAHVGPETERDIYYGIKQETIEITDDKGKVKKQKISTMTVPTGGSPYARIFSYETAPFAWAASPEMNLHFLRCQQTYANDKLHANGHVFLNEIYDAIGLPRSAEGAVTGWLKDSDGDNFIDFGLHDLDFYTKYGDFDGTYSIPLDFNVDGVIYNLI